MLYTKPSPGYHRNQERILSCRGVNLMLYIIKAAVYLKAVLPPRNLGLMRIFRSRNLKTVHSSHESMIFHVL